MGSLSLSFLFRPLNDVNLRGMPYIIVTKQTRQKTKAGKMGRILKLLLFLIVLCGTALVVFAFLGDLSPQRGEVQVPVTLDAQ